MKPGFTFSPSGCLVTPKGLVIGGAYQPPAKDQGKSAEAIQSALLLVSNAHPKVAPVAKPLVWKFEDFVRRWL